MTIEDRIRTLDAAALDAFPLGISRLDLRGTILFFNKAELKLMNRTLAETVGKDFFRDVAPCTVVKEHQGRFHDFVATLRPRSETFAFSYPFSFGRKDVTLTMVMRNADEGSIYIVTEFSRETSVA